MIGRHDGLAYYTLGQRQGLGIGGTRDGTDAALVRRGEGSARAMRWSPCRATTIRCCTGASVDAIDMHWISGHAARAAARASAPRRATGCPTRRARWRPRAMDARATFDAPQWAPTPGQYLVLYDGDVCLGGGVIDAAPAERGARAVCVRGGAGDRA